MPPPLQGQQEEASWLIHVLKEQCELLEIVLLYFKDYTHTAPDLLATATRFQSLGFGRKQHSRVGLVPAAEPLLNHIRWVELGSHDQLCFKPLPLLQPPVFSDTSGGGVS